MRIVFLVLVVVLLGAVTPTGAEVRDFGLWNACRPMRMQVILWEYESARKDLAEEAITGMVRRILRAARLYSSEDATGQEAELVVWVHNLGGVFSARFYFRKWVSDLINGGEGHATTWYDSVRGRSEDLVDVLSGVSQRLTDNFIDAYLRANESACSRSPIDP